MDKKRRNQIILIIVGLLLTSMGYYFYYLHIDSIISLLVSTTGVAILILGIRYKARSNMKKLEGEERSAYLRSAHFIIIMIGLVIFFIGLGGATLANYMHAGITIFWFLAIAFAGFLIALAGRVVKAADESIKS